MSKVLQTDGSNRACNLMIWRHQATTDAYHQAASQLVFTCTVAAICCKSSRSIHSNVKGLANRWQQPRLQSADARCIPPSRQFCNQSVCCHALPRNCKAWGMKRKKSRISLAQLPCLHGLHGSWVSFEPRSFQSDWTLGRPFKATTILAKNLQPENAGKRRLFWWPPFERLETVMP